MEPDQWNDAADLFERAVELPTEEREAFLHQASHRDPEVLDLVRRMLANDSETSWFLDLTAGRLMPLVEAPAPDLPAGSVMGGFEILGELGRGGMGVVYKARDRRLGRLAALKFLAVSSSPGARERLIAEARAAAALDHPNIASVFQVGEAPDGRLFIALACYEGETLADRLARGPIPAPQATDIATQLAAGLAAAHEAGLVHRDVKPANVFLTDSGVVKLLDFGIASQAGDRGEATGTVAYMSPEQSRGEAPDPRSDVWGWGLVSWEMLTGHSPWEGIERGQLIHRLRDGQDLPAVRAVDHPLGGLIQRSVRVDASERPADAGRLLEEIAAQQPARSSTRTRVGWGAAILAMALAVFALARDWNAGLTGPAAAAADAGPSVAVFPFASQGAEGTEYFAAGITDQVVTALASAEAITVVVPSAVQALATSGRTSQEIGRRLGAAYVLEGGVQRAEGRVRIQATLSRSEDGRVVWADDYERALTVEDLFRVQSEVGEAVASRLRARIAPAAVERLRSAPTSQMEAYDLLLLGDFELVRRTPVSVTRAIAAYREASQLDPTFTAALAMESYGYSVFIDWGWPYPGLDRSQLLERGLALADSALAMDSTSADAWLARGFVLVQRDPARMSGALPALERAIALDPSKAETHHQYGQSLMALGQWTEALAAYHAALAVEPTRAMTLVPMAAMSLRMGDRAEAVRWSDSAIAVGGNVPYAWAARANIRLQVEDPEGARADAEAALRIDPSFGMPARATLAASLHRLGDSTAAALELERAIGTLPDPSVPTTNSALYVGGALVTLGREEEALDFIERARPRSAWLWFYLQYPSFDPIRDRPRFRALVEAIDPRRAPTTATP